MQENKIYEEKIFLKPFKGIFAIIPTIFLVLIIYQALIGPIGTRPAPNWFLLLMFLFFVGITLNFSRLTIRATSNSINVRYGISKHSILWNNVTDCNLDKTPIRSYGGWGIRVGNVKGRRRLVYNVVGYPRVLLALNKGKFREFVFSTTNPDVVIKVIRQQIEKVD